MVNNIKFDPHYYIVYIDDFPYTKINIQIQNARMNQQHF